MSLHQYFHIRWRLCCLAVTQRMSLHQYFHIRSRLCCLAVTQRVPLQHYFHSRWCSCCLAVTQRMSLHQYFHVWWCSCCLVVTQRVPLHQYFHVRWCSCRFAEAQRVPLVKQQVLTLPKHQLFLCGKIESQRILWWRNRLKSVDFTYIYHVMRKTYRKLDEIDTTRNKYMIGFAFIRIYVYFDIVVFAMFSAL